MIRRPLALAALLAVSLAACDSASEFVIGGDYEGVTERTSTVETRLLLSLPTVESGGSFSFSGTVSEVDSDGDVLGTEEIRGNGTYDHPNLTLTVEGEVAEGTVSDDGDVLLLVTEAGDAPARLVRIMLD